MKWKKNKNTSQSRRKAKEITKIEENTKKSEKTHNVNKHAIIILANLMTIGEKTEDTETTKTTMTETILTEAEDEESKFCNRPWREIKQMYVDNYYILLCKILISL